MEDVLTSEEVILNIDSDKINEFIEQYLRVDKNSIILSSNDISDISGVEKIEPYFNTILKNIIIIIYIIILI